MKCAPFREMEVTEVTPLASQRPRSGHQYSKLVRTHTHTHQATGRTYQLVGWWPQQMGACSACVAELLEEGHEAGEQTD